MSRSEVQVVDIGLPLGDVWPKHSSVIGQKTVHFSFDIGSLRIDRPTAGEHFSLLSQLVEDEVTSIVPDIHRIIQFISLIDPVDGLLNIPQMVDRDIVAQTAKLSLETDSSGIVRTRRRGIERSSALGRGVLKQGPSAVLKRFSRRT